MYKLIKQQKQYTRLRGDSQLPLSMDFETAIAPDDSVRLLSHVLEELNYKKLYQAYSHKGRKPGVESIILFKVIVYAFMEGIYSTCEIEKACRRDINFKCILQDYPPPGHGTIARFIKNYLVDCFEDLFYQQIHLLHALHKVNFEHLLVDGTKIEANANKYTFVWKKTINKNEKKMYVKIEALFNTLQANYLTTLSLNPDQVKDSLSQVLAFLKNKQQEEQVMFVHGIGKRKSLLQKLTEQTQIFLERQEKYDRSNALFQGRNSYSKTDHEVTFMHMKEDHMRNAQLKPGYNIQIGVESEYITGMDVYSDRSDVVTLIPFLEKMQGLLIKILLLMQAMKVRKTIFILNHIIKSPI